MSVKQNEGSISALLFYPLLLTEFLELEITESGLYRDLSLCYEI